MDQVEPKVAAFAIVVVANRFFPNSFEPYSQAAHALGEYNNSRIVVLAPDAETARKKAIEEFKRDIRDRYGWALMHASEDEFWADEGIADATCEITADLDAEPESHNVIFIRGSE